MAERASQVDKKNSFISFISSTSEAAKPMTAGQKIERSDLHGIRGDSRQGDCL